MSIDELNRAYLAGKSKPALLIDVERANEEIVSYTNGELSTKQDTLVSGSNIKTINGDDILGTGNYTIIKSVSVNGSFPISIDGAYNDFYIDASSGDVTFIFDIATVKDLQFDLTMEHQGHKVIIGSLTNTEKLSLKPLPQEIYLYDGENLTIRSDGNNLWVK